MSMTNFTLPQNIHNTQKMPVRPSPDKYRQSLVAERGRFTVSEGVIPAEYFQVYRYLPVLDLDITIQDYLVIPKGRVVAAISSEDATPAGGMVTPSGAGSIYTFTNAITNAITSVGIDTSYFGYDENISCLLVPCNGGSALTSGYYTTADVTNGNISSGGALVAAGDTFALPANAPVGVAFHDWYQDIRGRNLNYRQWADGGHVLCDFYIEVPYVKVNAGVGDPVVTNASYATYLDKWSVNKKFTYLAVNDGTDVFQPGVFVASDLIGNYKIQGAGSSLTQNQTTQTVGRIVAIDNRFPKAGLEDVETYPGSGMPGTQTAGIPKFLFDFVVACRKLNGGSTPTIEDVYNLVRAGYYGVARIQLMVA